VKRLRYRVLYIGLGFQAYGLGCRVQGCGLELTVASVGYQYTKYA